MYRLTINGTYRGHYKTAEEVLAQVEKWARPFRHPWKIEDQFGKIYTQG